MIEKNKPIVSECLEKKVSYSTEETVLKKREGPKGLSKVVLTA